MQDTIEIIKIKIDMEEIEKGFYSAVNSKLLIWRHILMI